MLHATLPRKSSSRFPLWVCFASCGLTIAILMAVYALRGIWPFGTDNVAYVDTAQFFIPDYYTLWDVMHGAASAQLNWFPGLAEAGTASWASLLRYDIDWTCFLNPANWVFLFVARDHILESLSLYLAVYMAMTAFMASLVLCLRFPRIGPLWQIALSLLYAFSGFVLQYYSNFGWFTVIALFPLLLFSLERLLRDGKYLLYAVVYAYFLYRNVYFSYMATLYILLFAFGYCVFLLPKRQRGERIFRLGLSTAAALGVCACFLLGSSLSLMGTDRFQSNLDSGLITGFTTWNIPNTRHTTLMLLGMALVAALSVLALRRQRLDPPEQKRRRKRVIWFFAYILGMLFIPVVFTNIDTAWHFGQYNFFPMRYGFMLPATLLAAAALILEEEADAPSAAPADKPRFHTVARAAGATAAVAALAVLVPRLDAYFTEYGSCFLNALGANKYWRYFALYVGCGILFAAAYVLLFRLKNRRIATVFIAVILLLQVGSNAVGLVAPSDDHTYTNEYDPAYIETADSLYEYFSALDASPLARAKNVDNSLNAAYPVIAGVSALSTVNSLNSSTTLNAFRGLGYTVNYFRVLDTGGTVFSDMLLGVQYVLSAGELDGTLYVGGDTVDGIQIGTALYPGRIGLMFETGALDDYAQLSTISDRLNALYQAFTDSQAQLAYTPDTVLAVEGEGLKTYTLTCTVPETAFLYMAADGVLLNITANGQAVTVPSYQNLENTVYPASFNSNLVYLGLAGPGETVIQFSSALDLTEEDITLVALERQALDSFYAAANMDDGMTLETTSDSLSITITASAEGQSLFLPLMYTDRWQCTVNGQTVEPGCVMEVLMSIPLQAGENTILLTRGHTAVSPTGLAISAVCLALAILWLLLRRFRPQVTQIAVPGFVYTGARWLYYLVCAAVFAFIYIAPTVYLILQGSIVYF